MHTATLIPELPLAKALEGEVEGWRNQGWPGVTPTTHELLRHWFEERGDASEAFYDCQRHAIETAIYCHEILQVKALRGVYEKLAPEVLLESEYVRQEIDSIPSPKYCLKMATGSGKTWVLAALVVWQYFNHMNGERPGSYSGRFMVATPGHEVLNRMLDSFKGKRDPRTGNRDPNTSDYKKDLFMPDNAYWRGRFHLEIKVPEDVRANVEAPDGPFVFLTNWQQFRFRDKKPNLWEYYTGEDVEEQPRGEVIADFLSEFPDLIVMNDEAHHVHSKKARENEELVWRRFMTLLYERLSERHADDQGLFMQVDFSATPFYGSGVKREYFPHIVYDYDLREAMQDMLVKQVFLEERQTVGGEKLEGLDFRAERGDKGTHRMGRPERLSAGQKVLLDIGRRKLEQIEAEFKERGIAKKPVMLVLCEETDVAGLVKEHFGNLSDPKGNCYDDSRVMMIHSDLPDAELEKSRRRLDKIDDDEDPLRVVISVLMLREGFDKNNICVIAVLRATEADLLLEQIVGRGLRQMFPRYASPEIWAAKEESFQLLRRGKRPPNSLDFLFIVEHPRFRQFYEQLRQQGYLISSGDTSQVHAAGDIRPVDAVPSRIPDLDIGWPLQIFEHGKPPDLSGVDLSKLAPYSKDFHQLKHLLGKMAVQDVYMDTGAKVKTWKLDNQYFDYQFYLEGATKAIARSGKQPLFSGLHADIARLVDDYTTRWLFGREIDFTRSENYQVLNYTLVFDHVVETLRRAIVATAEQITFETRGIWHRLSELSRIIVRESRSIETQKSIYPRLPYSAVGGGFERDFMLEVLEASAEVDAYAKIDRKHPLKITYRDENGIQRDYEVDFLVKTPETTFLAETKAEKDLVLPTVQLKARAAQSWCEVASSVAPPRDLKQAQPWEYLVVSEKLFQNNRGLSFEALRPLCAALRDQLIAQAESRLAV
jgi:type III restriction enzyme